MAVGRRPHWLLALTVLLAAAVVALGLWWWRGGTYLKASGVGLGAPVAVGDPLSMGIDLVTSSGPSVVLASATTPGIAGLRVSWSVFRNGPHQPGFGSWVGPLAPTYPTVPVHGFVVAQPANHPERGATWLVMTVLASRPGVYHLDRIDIRYHSGGRARHASGNADLCLLAYPASDKTRLLAQVTAFQPRVTPASALDPLVAKFEACQHLETGP